MNKFILLWFGLVITLIYPSCKCCKDPGNPDCKNYDPCYGKEATSADFICYAAPLASYQDSFRATLSATDSVYTWGAVFEARQKDFDSIKWKIGDELNYRTNRSCYVDFGGRPSERIGTIPVTCIIYRRPNTSCFPADDGIDTVSRPIHILSLADAPIYGTYRGKFVTEDYYKDSFNVTVRYDNSSGYEKAMVDSLYRNLPYSSSFGYFIIGNELVDGLKTDKIIFLNNNSTMDAILINNKRSSYYQYVTGDTSKKDRHWVGYKL